MSSVVSVTTAKFAPSGDFVQRFSSSLLQEHEADLPFDITPMTIISEMKSYFHSCYHLFLMVFVGLTLMPCLAQNPLKVTMISESSAFVPGKLNWIGFRLQHPKGYHSYSEHPGGIGCATSISWDLPKGISAGEILWPYPQPVMMGEHRAQGYRNEVLLMVPMTVATTKRHEVTLRAKLDWLCCGKVCHHAYQMPFSLTLPVRNQSAQQSSKAAIFSRARRRLPTYEPLWDTSFQQKNRRIILTIHPKKGGTSLGIPYSDPWFATLDGVIDSTMPQDVFHQSDGSMHMHLPIHELAPDKIDELRGILIIPRYGSPNIAPPALFIRANRAN
jgi:thiol:disulfide interchange protein DsbD